MNRRRFLTAAVTLAAAGPASGTRPDPKGRIKIVSSMLRTGSAQGMTDTIVNGIRMAIDAHGGAVAGFRIDYLDLDDASPATGTWEAALEEANAKRAAADPDVVAVIGPYNSGAAKVSMPILNRAGLVQVSPAATWPGLTKKQPGDTSGEPDIYRPAKRVTFCRVCLADDVQAGAAAAFAADHLKAKTVYVLDDQQLYGRGEADRFVGGCEARAVKVLGREGADVFARDYTRLVKKVAALKPDLVYFGGTTQTDAPSLVRALAAAGPECPILLPDGCYEQAFIDAVGADATRTRACYVTTGGVDPDRLTGRGAEFARAYAKKYQSAPSAYAVYGYEAARVVLAAVETAGTKDRETVRRAVLATRDFDRGALPKWSFDADGDTTARHATVYRVVAGKFAFVRTIEAPGPARPGR